jgi:hypothetical protein
LPTTRPEQALAQFRVGYHVEKMPNESPTSHRTIDARRIAWLICFVLSLLALTTLVVTGVITLRIFAWLCLFLMTGSGVVLYRLLRTALPTSGPANPNWILNLRKRWYVLAAGLLWLIFALWISRGDPWLPRLVGVSVFLLLIIGITARRAS